MKGDWAIPIDLTGMQYTIRKHEAYVRPSIMDKGKRDVVARQGGSLRSEVREKVLAEMRKGKWFTRRTLRETFGLHMDAADSLIQRMMRDGEITKKKDTVGGLLFGAAHE